MPISPVLETIDELSDDLKALYQEGPDGRFHLDLDDSIREHQAVTPLKTAHERQKEGNQKLRAQLTEAMEKLSSLPEDFDPEKWNVLKSIDPDKTVPRDEAVKLRETYEKEMQALKAEAETYRNQLQSTVIERELSDALNSVGVTRPEFIKASRAILANQVQLSEDGKAVVETDMGPIALSEHIKRWVGGEGKAFVTEPRGAGSGGANGSANLSSSKPATKMDAKEKSLFIRENGLDAWTQKLAADKRAAAQ